MCVFACSGLQNFGVVVYKVYRADTALECYWGARSGGLGF